jgi:hypothetical protein
MNTLYFHQNPLKMMTFACQQASNPLSPALFLTRSPLPKPDLLLLLSLFPCQTLQNVYIKELRDLDTALHYISEDLTHATDLPGLVLLYTEMDETGWEVVAALQHAISLLKTPAICGCPEDIHSIALSARRFFKAIVGELEWPQTT